MASSSSAASCFNAQPSAMRRSSASSFARGSQGGIAPLQRRAVLSGGSGRLARGPVRAAMNPQRTSPTNAQMSSYNPPLGRDTPGGPRDMYEGTTGIDVLAMQKELVAEGYLTPSDATGCVLSARAIRSNSPRGGALLFLTSCVA